MVPDPKRWHRSLTLMFMIAAEPEYLSSAVRAEARRLGAVFG
jgi:hypothetical protein